MASGIYQILNTTNGKRYIGSAVNLERRKLEHWSQLRRGVHHNPHLQAAWDKYGEATFTFDIFLTCEKHELIDYEQLCIDEETPGYNICLTAGNCLGRPMSDETKLKLSAAHMGKKFSAESIAKRSATVKGHPGYMLGKKQSAEAKQKITDSLKGRTCSAETRKRISEANIELYEYKGVKRSRKDWAAILGLTLGSFKARLYDHKGNPEKIFMPNNTTKNSPSTGVAMNTNSNLESASTLRGNTADLIKGV
jgi:group I intron endonuclease